ncbi:MAG: hypothetical protein WBD20_00185 [Pirellulaceae bacterium]
MTSAMKPQSNLAIDPARIARIVREVIARLQQSPNTQPTGAAAVSIDEKIVTAKSIEQLVGQPKQIFIGAKAIVTPAARDAAKENGITINRSVPLTKNQVPESPCSKNEISDAANPDRAASLASQLARRGIKTIGKRIVLSDTPAADVFRFCSEAKERAVMLSSINDVDRFAAELNPTVWVMDMQRMNLMSAVNAAAQIAQK